MSQFRTQLRKLKDEYELTRYPGDLASDLPSPSHLHWGRVGWALGAIAAVAAVVAATVMLQQPNNPGGLLPVDSSNAVAVDDQSGQLSAWLTVQSIPAMPQDVNLVPVMEDASMPEVPSFPSFETMVSEAEANQSVDTEEQR